MREGREVSGRRKGGRGVKVRGSEEAYHGQAQLKVDTQVWFHPCA